VPVTKTRSWSAFLPIVDLRFETRTDILISKIMTKDNLITVPVGTTWKTRRRYCMSIAWKSCWWWTTSTTLKGLITVKDIQKKLKYPGAAKDQHGRLRVGAAIGGDSDYLERAQEMVKAKVDVLAIDSAHGHTSRVIEAVKRINRNCRKWICWPAT